VPPEELETGIERAPAVVIVTAESKTGILFEKKRNVSWVGGEGSSKLRHFDTAS
jgi:hypothetical protein